MDILLGDLADNVIHYVDDILIATNGSLEDHLDMVAQVLKRLQDGNLKIRPKKITIARDTIEFLGIIWKKGTISIPEAKLKAFHDLPSPNTPKKAKSLVCALAYYRKFIPRFAELAKPIMDLASVHPQSFKWTPDLEKNFRTIIDLICQHSTIHLPDPSKPYYVQTDASRLAGAGRIFQKDDEGNEKLIACISRTFTKTERAYSTIKKEVVALLYTLKTMDFFLLHCPKIIIMIDAQAIIFLRLCRESTGILLRFSIELSKYEAEIEHVPGEDNIVSDVLSRQHVDIDKIMEEEKVLKPMTEQQAVAILSRLKCPEGQRFTKEEVAWMLDAESLPNPIQKSPRKSSAKLGKRELKNIPALSLIHI